MATEGEEDWLYGNDKKADEPPAPGTEASETPSQLSADATPFQPKEESTVGADGADGAGEGEGEDKEEDESAVLDEDDEEDDDSDDDVQVTIGAIKTQASYDTPKFKGGYQRPVGQQGPKPAATKGVDVEAVGSVNGVPLFEFDLDSVEDKPWRKPGADITDYFNYGFTEDTWSKYSEKQRRLRIENNATGVQVFVNHPDRHSRGGGPRHPFHRHEYKPPGSTPDSHKPYFKPKYESPIHSQPTTINVIGSTNRDTRRPFQQEFDMDIKESNSYGNPSQTPPPPGVPDAFTRPPPHVHVSEAPPSSIPVMIPPVSMAGQAISVAGVTPVSITSQLPPQMVPTVTGYTGLPPTSVPPPGMGPPPNMQGPPPGMIGPPPGMIGPPPGFGPPPQTNMPPPGFPGGPPPQAFGPPPGSMGGPPLRGPPPGGFPGERPPFNSFPPPGGGGHPRFGGPPPWERGRKERDWMDLPLSDDDLSPGSDDDRKRRRKHDRDRDRDRRRRSRSRDRERRHRDDRHSRSRRDRERSRDDERSRYSSRSYKDSKSSKRDSEPLEGKSGSPGP